MNEDATDWGYQAYDRDTVDRVWRTGMEVPGNDPAVWRKDEYGAWMHRLEYGRRHSDFGWEVLDPTVRMNHDLLALRPLQWQNYLDRLAAGTQSRITADGLRNARRLL